MARLQALAIGLGKAKQADIATVTPVAGVWHMNKINAHIANPNYRTENDAAELGKGHPYATAIYKSHIESGPHTLEKYLSSEFAAWLFAFGLGKVTVSGSGSYVYTCRPLSPATDGYEPPYFTYVEQLTEIGRDLALIGNAIKSFKVSINKGTGRTNAKATVEFLHSGTSATSGITLPAAVSEHLLNAYSLAFTANSVDYVTLKNFESVEFGWDNDLVPGYYPGSGQQDGYQVMGKMEIGNQVPSFSMTARFVSGSTELDKVRDLTTGSVSINLTADANNSMVVSYEKMAFSAAELSENDRHVIVSVTGTPMADTANSYDVMQAVVTTPAVGICQ